MIFSCFSSWVSVWNSRIRFFLKFDIIFYLLDKTCYFNYYDICIFVNFLRLLSLSLQSIQKSLHFEGSFRFSLTRKCKQTFLSISSILCKCIAQLNFFIKLKIVISFCSCSRVQNGSRKNIESSEVGQIRCSCQIFLMV